MLYHSLESTHIATASFLLPLCCGTHYLLHWSLSKLTWQQLICCLFLLFKFSIIIRAIALALVLFFSSFYALFIQVALFTLLLVVFSFTSRLRRGGAPLYDNAELSPIQYWKKKKRRTPDQERLQIVSLTIPGALSTPTAFSISQLRKRTKA